MYRILVVDDEPAAIKHICNIIAIKCPQFDVTATAEHGQEALKRMEEDTPDILITDVKMPVMDGIALAERVKERYPEVLSLVVSGYQEFEYAKAAIRSGVYDYLLKPIKPSALQNALNSMEEVLAERYARKRNFLMKSLCEKNSVDRKLLERYFPAGKYYAALVRRNGLPRRYSGNSGFEIFSGRDEKIYLYGRDEMEAMYLYPEDILFYKSFYQIISETIRREHGNSNYVTGIIRETPFSIGRADDVFLELYQLLDSSIVIGASQILIAEELKEDKRKGQGGQETTGGEFQALENYIQKGQREKIISAVAELFDCWKRTKRTQMYVEAQVRYLLILMDKSGLLSGMEQSSERILDDLFFYAEDLDEVSDAIQNMLMQKIKKEPAQQKMDTEEFFKRITGYMERHLSEELSMGRLCKEFGLSPTYLNKLFRKYSGSSFNKCLTLARIQCARDLMDEGTSVYVKDVAARAGYNDQFYFSRIFASVVGVSPSDYMERVQNQKKGQEIQGNEQ